MKITPKVLKAVKFMQKAHNDVGQVRKYTGEPYWVHPLETMAIVGTVTDDEDMLAAMALHDTIEDTEVTIEDIKREFGPRVASLVEELTDVSKPEDGDRDVRKAMDFEHTAKASADGKTLKLADLISNSKNIAFFDPDFAEVYMREKRKLLTVLGEGHTNLYTMAKDIVEDYFLKTRDNLTYREVARNKRAVLKALENETQKAGLVKKLKKQFREFTNKLAFAIDRGLLKATQALMDYCERNGKIFKITGTAGPEDVYLIRYYVIKSQYFNFFIHQFLRSDRDDLHDHPWDFCTYLVSGAYTENKYNEQTKKVEETRRCNYEVNKTNGYRYVKNKFVFRKATDQHQVVVDKDLKEKDKAESATTLFFSGPTKREWGFIKEEIKWMQPCPDGRPGCAVNHGKKVRTWIKWTTYLGLPDNTKSRG